MGILKPRNRSKGLSDFSARHITGCCWHGDDPDLPVVPRTKQGPGYTAMNPMKQLTSCPRGLWTPEREEREDPSWIIVQITVDGRPIEDDVDTTGET